MSGRNGTSSNYVPLSQTNIDSDSEEELDTHQINRNRRDNGQPDYSVPLAINGFLDAAPIVASPSHKSALSTTRKFFFALSIFVCFLTIIGFVWLVPCNVNPCIAKQSAVGAKSWETPLYDLEIHGPIAVVVSAHKDANQGNNLVLLARRAVTAPQPLRHQVLCLLGSDGNLAWTHMLAREPQDLQCGILDANQDGVKDCIVSGSEDLLKTVDPLSGMSIWELGSTSNDSHSLRTQRPLLLPDITGDSIPDLLTSRSFPKFSHFLLISGASGKVIGQPVPYTICVDIVELVLEKDFSISYTCLDTHRKRSEQIVELDEIMERAGWSKNWASVNKSGFVIAENTAPDADIEARVSGRRLLLENRGHCPNDCYAVIVIKDNNNRTLYNHSLENVHGMAPAILSFERLNGFVIKLWQWHGRKANKRLPNNISSNVTDDSHFRWRDIDGIWVEVSERVLLMTFNDSDSSRVNVHVVNVSQQNLVQLCQRCTPVGCDCQPASQASCRSLQIADLDGDGSRELISYYSSFVPSGQNEHEGKQKTARRLEARVRVVRLEAELPLLYQSLAKPSY